MNRVTGLFIFNFLVLLFLSGCEELGSMRSASSEVTEQKPTVEESPEKYEEVISYETIRREVIVSAKAMVTYHQGAFQTPYDEDSVSVQHLPPKINLDEVDPNIVSFTVTGEGSWGHCGGGACPSSWKGYNGFDYDGRYYPGNGDSRAFIPDGVHIPLGRAVAMLEPKDGIERSQSFYRVVGLTDNHEFTIPPGAKTIVLGFNDGVEWNNNWGSVKLTFSFKVKRVTKKLALL